MPVLYRFVTARLGPDRETVTELVQSTLCKVFENLRRYRGEASLVTWACGICRFQIFALYRQRKRSPQQVELMEETAEIRGALESLSGEPRDPEERLRREQLVRLVHLTLDHLPRRYSQALDWKYNEGLSVQEIADRLEVSAKAAESVLSRARAAFRDAFTTISGEMSKGAGVATS